MTEYAYLIIRKHEPTVAVFTVMPGGLLVHKKTFTADTLTRAVSISCEFIDKLKEGEAK